MSPRSPPTGLAISGGPPWLEKAEGIQTNGSEDENFGEKMICDRLSC
jgi:hypothetical protein